MVNFRLLAAEISLVVWGTPANFNGFHVLAALLHGIPVVGVKNSAELNSKRHLYLAGQPSHWALAYILGYLCFTTPSSLYSVSTKNAPLPQV